MQSLFGLGFGFAHLAVHGLVLLDGFQRIVQGELAALDEVGGDSKASLSHGASRRDCSLLEREPRLADVVPFVRKPWKTEPVFG